MKPTLNPFTKRLLLGAKNEYMSRALGKKPARRYRKLGLDVLTLEDLVKVMTKVGALDKRQAAVTKKTVGAPRKRK